MTSAALAAELRARGSELDGLHVVTGFDGFVDEMIELVGERQSLEAYSRVESIPDFGALVNASAGHSSLREIVIRRMDPGGCAVNMGDGLAALGVPVQTFATVGDPVHAAFQDYASRAGLHSWGQEPGRTLAFEFQDGKLMFSSVSPLASFTPEHVRRMLADGSFANACETAQVIAFTDWTLFPHMTACWRVLRKEVLDHLPHRPTLFFDLVDPSSRSRKDIQDMLAEISEFSGTCEVVLGLNRKEAGLVSEALDLPSDPGTEDLDPLAVDIRERMMISDVVVHSRLAAWSADETGTTRIDTTPCMNPIKSTGAGDRFNAGYALGLLLNLPQADRLRLANTCAGLYVRTAQSPSFEDIIQVLESGTYPPPS